jgi:hypothetical protein
VSRPWAPPSPGRVGKNLVKKKPAQWVFLVVFGLFGVFWVFWIFFLFVHRKSVSKRKVCIIFIKNKKKKKHF